MIHSNALTPAGTARKYDKAHASDPDLTLNDYLIVKNIDRKVFAKTIKVSEPSLCRYLNGTRIPRRDVMRRIFAETGGRVPPSSFLFPPDKMVSFCHTKPTTRRRAGKGEV
jgi:hypothetical protein